MGNLVFQATLGGQVNLVGPNTASTFNLNVPAVAGTLVTTGDTGTVTNTMCATSVYTAPGTIGSGTPNTGAFTTLSASSTTTLSGGTANGIAYLNGSKVVTTGSAITFDGTNFATTGTASATKLIPTGGSATGTGLYLPAANTLAWSNNGSETMRLDSSGNLGLGVTPSAWGSGSNGIEISGKNGQIVATTPYFTLGANTYYNGSNYIYKTSGTATYYQQNNGAHIWYNAASGTAGNAITFTQAMTLDASGRLLVGTTGAAYVAAGRQNMAVSGSSQAAYEFQVGGTGVGYLIGTSNNVEFGASGFINFVTNGAERARIDSSGNLLVGTTSNTGSGASSGKIVVQFNGAAANGIYYDDTRTSAGSDVAAVFGRGTTVVGRLDTTLTSLTLTNLSDQRVKTNIQDSGSAMSLVGSVKVRQFDWTIDESHEDFGFIAQELNEVLPQAVSVGKTEEEMWGVNFVKLVPILTKAIQELKAEVDSLKAQIAGA